MKKQNLVTVLIGLIITSTGICIDRFLHRPFLGGMLAGSAIFYTITVTVGSWVHAKLMKKMDKGIRDFILMRYKNN